MFLNNNRFFKDKKGVTPVVAAILLIALIFTAVAFTYVMVIPQYQRMKLKQDQESIVSGLSSLGNAINEISVGRASETKTVTIITNKGDEFRSFNTTAVRQGIVVHYDDAGGNPQVITLVPLSNLPVLAILFNAYGSNPIQYNRHNILSDPLSQYQDTFFISPQSNIDVGRTIINLTRPIMGITDSAGYLFLFRVSITYNTWQDSLGNPHLEIIVDRIILYFPTAIASYDDQHVVKASYFNTTISQTQVTATGTVSVVGTTFTDEAHGHTETPFSMSIGNTLTTLHVSLITHYIQLQEIG